MYSKFDNNTSEAVVSNKDNIKFKKANIKNMLQNKNRFRHLFKYQFKFGINNFYKCLID
jgi:hypothetical protein